jgi:hypothetical protein
VSITKRILALVSVVTTTLVGLAGTAFAGPAPIAPDTGDVSTTPVVIDHFTTTSTVSGWQLALLALAAALTAAALTAAVTAFNGRHRTRVAAHAQAA